MLANKLEEVINESFPELPCFYIGAVRRSQCTELIGGILYALEKGLDCQGHFAIADADIANFDDMIDPVVFRRIALSLNFDPDLVAVIFRFIVYSSSIRARFRCFTF